MTAALAGRHQHNFSHCHQIVLLNQAGDIHYRLQGLVMDVAPLVAAIKQLQ
ncbi:MAG: hypothetical protein ACI85K_003094 [Hyphomicrobiaceae bacterium]|jgi:hypothetical protein